jgi:hypothetical protein
VKGIELKDGLKGHRRRRPMSVDCHFEEPTTIRTHIGAIFVSLELSRSTWLITSVSPGAGEKMSKHSVPSGDIAELLARLYRTEAQGACADGTNLFPSLLFKKPVWTGSGFIAFCDARESRAMSSTRPRLRRYTGVGGSRRIGSTVKLRCGFFWLSSAASRASAPGAFARERGSTLTSS